MQRRDEHNLITTLELVRALAFQFPIRVVDEDEDAWSTVFSLVPSEARGRLGKRIREDEDVHGIPIHEQLGTFPEEVRA